MASHKIWPELTSLLTVKLKTMFTVTNNLLQFKIRGWLFQRKNFPPPPPKGSSRNAKKYIYSRLSRSFTARGESNNVKSFLKLTFQFKKLVRSKKGLPSSSRSWWKLKSYTNRHQLRIPLRRNHPYCRHLWYIRNIL